MSNDNWENVHPWTLQPGWKVEIAPTSELEQRVKDGWQVWISGDDGDSVFYRNICCQDFNHKCWAGTLKSEQLIYAKESTTKR